MSECIIREAKPGEPSLVVNFYYHLFEKQFNFFPSTEQYFFHAMSDLWNDIDENKLLIIEKAGEILGSICVVKVDKGQGQIRMFGISPKLQGKGYGVKLMDTAMEYCKKMNYDNLILWTADICQAARHLYAKYGFVLTETKSNNIWADYSITEEKWKFDKNAKVPAV